MIIFAVLSFIGIKIAAQAQASQTTAATAAATSAGNSQASAGNAPTNFMPASPAPIATDPSQAQAPVASTDDGSGDDDDGAMSGTAAAVSGAFTDTTDIASGLGNFDTNETQSSSGSDNAASDSYRSLSRGKGQNYNRVLDRLWNECLDVDYMCSQPGVAAHRFHAPGVQRQDWNPSLNNQPWARNQSFAGTDPTSYFETDDMGITPSIDNDSDDEPDGSES